MDNEYEQKPPGFIKKTTFSKYKFYPFYFLAIIGVSIYFFQLSMKATASMKVFQSFQNPSLSLPIKNDSDNEQLLSISNSLKDGSVNIQSAIKENQNGASSKMLPFLIDAQGDFDDIKLRTQLLQNQSKRTTLQVQAADYLQTILLMKQGIGNGNSTQIANGITAFEMLRKHSH